MRIPKLEARQSPPAGSACQSRYRSSAVCRLSSAEPSCGQQLAEIDAPCKELTMQYIRMHTIDVDQHRSDRELPWQHQCTELVLHFINHDTLYRRFDHSISTHGRC